MSLLKPLLEGWLQAGTLQVQLAAMHAHSNYTAGDQRELSTLRRQSARIGVFMLLCQSFVSVCLAHILSCST